MRFSPPALTMLLLALAGCASTDPAADQRDVTEALRRRGGVDLPDDHDPTVGATEAELADLLRTPLQPETAVRIALHNNHRVRALYARLGIARADLAQAGLLRNPVADVQFVKGGGTDYEFGIVQPVLELLFLPLRNSLAEHEFTATKLRLTDELVSLVFTVRRAFVEAQAAALLVEVHRQALAAAIAAHELTVELHAAGNVTDQGLAIEQAAESRMRLDLAAAEQAAREAREPLQNLLGLWGAMTDWQLEGELPPDPLLGIDLAQVEGRAVAASIDLQAHRAGLEALARQAGLDSWRGWFPELGLGLSGLKNTGGKLVVGPRAEFVLPLFDHGAATRAGNAARLQAGMHEHVQLGVEVRSAARLLRDRATLLAERARFLREVHLPHRAEVVRTTLQTYNAMQIGVFEVLLQTQLQLADQRDHVATLRQAHLARLDLQQLLAGSQPGTALERLVEGQADTPTIRGSGPGVVR